MNSDEGINEILDILGALLDGIEPENYDDHAAPAGHRRFNYNAFNSIGGHDIDDLGERYQGHSARN